MNIKILKIKSILKCIRIFGLFEFLKNLFIAYTNKKPNNFKYELGITAILKNEAPYIAEWLEFHKLLGVSKFYLYDNESTDNIKTILAPYIENGTVDYTYVEGKGKQAWVYNQSIKKNKNEVKWMAFIDIDEFITPVFNNTITEYLNYMEEKFGKFDALSINWLIHGFNNHYKKPDGLVIENFKKCDYRADRNNHIKTILNPRSVIMTYHPHFFIHKFGSKIINSKGNEMYGPFNEPCYDEILIHHYFTKSFMEHKERYKKGKADLSKTFLIEWAPYALSYDTDNTIERFISQLKERLSIMAE